LKKLTRLSLFLIISVLISNISTIGAKADDNKDQSKLLKEAKESFLLFTPQSIGKAIDKYNKVLENNPKNPDAYAGLAQSYSLLGFYNQQVKDDYENEFNKAHSYILKALALDKSNSNVKRALAYYYLHLSREKEAGKIADEILSKNKKDYEAMYISWASGAKHPEDVTISKALEENPEMIEARVDLAQVLFYRKARYSRAAEEVQKAIDIHDSPYLRDLLGNIYVNQHNYEKSADEFKRAMNMDPKFASAYKDYGISLFYKSKINDSIDQLIKSISLNPRFPEAYFYLAKNYERKGNHAKSDNYYKDFLRLAAGESKYYEMILIAKQNLKDDSK